MLRKSFILLWSLSIMAVITAGGAAARRTPIPKTPFIWMCRMAA